MGKAEPLFKRITEDEIKVLKAKFGGSQDKKPEEQSKAAAPVEAKANKSKKAPKSNDSTQKTPGVTTLADLTKEQATQFTRLEKVKNKLNQICESSDMSELKVYTETADDLSKLQANQSQRLDKMRNKLNNICDELGMLHLKTETPVVEAPASGVTKQIAQVIKQEVKPNIFNRVLEKANVNKINLVFLSKNKLN